MRPEDASLEATEMMSVLYTAVLDGLDKRLANEDDLLHCDALSVLEGIGRLRLGALDLFRRTRTERGSYAACAAIRSEIMLGGDICKHVEALVRHLRHDPVSASKVLIVAGPAADNHAFRVGLEAALVACSLPERLWPAGALMSISERGGDALQILDQAARKADRKGCLILLRILRDMPVMRAERLRLAKILTHSTEPIVRGQAVLLIRRVTRFDGPA
jgi:hypothetical protein